MVNTRDKIVRIQNDIVEGIDRIQQEAIKQGKLKIGVESSRQKSPPQKPYTSTEWNRHGFGGLCVIPGSSVTWQLKKAKQTH